MNTVAKRLTRSNRDRVFGGVCGGLAEYLEQDAVLVRVGFVALSLLSGVVGGLFVYLFAWLIIPLRDNTDDQNPPERSYQQSGGSRVLIGILLVAAGFLALLVAFLPPFWKIGTWRVTGPILLIVIGLVVAIRRRSMTDQNTQTEGTFQESRGQEIPPQSSSTPAIPKRLTRSHRGRKIAGVCAGLGNYFNIDPTIIRIIFLTLIFAGGTGFLLYLIMWIAAPLEE